MWQGQGRRCLQRGKTGRIVAISRAPNPAIKAGFTTLERALASPAERQKALLYRHGTARACRNRASISVGCTGNDHLRGAAARRATWCGDEKVPIKKIKMRVQLGGASGLRLTLVSGISSIIGDVAERLKALVC